ncbi:hypothetical protein D3C84_1265290 [compost metagenome]
MSRALNLDTGLRVSIAGPRAEDWLEALAGQGVRAARMEAASGEAVGLHLELLR